MIFHEILLHDKCSLELLWNNYVINHSTITFWLEIFKGLITIALSDIINNNTIVFVSYILRYIQSAVRIISYSKINPRIKNYFVYSMDTWKQLTVKQIKLNFISQLVRTCFYE